MRFWKRLRLPRLWKPVLKIYSNKFYLKPIFTNNLSCHPFQGRYSWIVYDYWLQLNLHMTTPAFRTIFFVPPRFLSLCYQTEINGRQTVRRKSFILWDTRSKYRVTLLCKNVHINWTHQDRDWLKMSTVNPLLSPPPPSNKPSSLISPPFQRRKVNKPPSLLSPPPCPYPNPYSSQKN